MQTTKDVSQYTIKNIHRGKDKRRHVLYAQLRDENDELVISATLDYIHTALKEMSRSE